MPDTRAEARRATALLSQHPWGPELVPWLAPSWRIHATRTPLADLALGASRFGGTPDLPREFAWPTGPNGAPLALVAQLAPSDFPDSIAAPLVFFYDASMQPWGHAIDHGQWRVMRLPHDARLERRAAPNGVTVFEPCSLTTELELTLPSLETLTALGVAPETMHRIERRPYAALRAALGPTNSAKSLHRFEGHPDEIQTTMNNSFATMLVERRWRTGINPFTKKEQTFRALTLANVPEDVKTFLHNTTDWKLLLQLDSDMGGPDWTWGDAGRLYFWIPAHDLQVQRFDRAWIRTQSH